MTTNIEIAKAEALELIRAHSWDQRKNGESTCGHPGCEDHPLTRKVIHTVMKFGADWAMEDALAAVEAAQTVQWGWSLMGHDLFIVTEDDRLVGFEVRAPEEIRQRWTEELRAERAAREAGRSTTSLRRSSSMWNSRTTSTARQTWTTS